MASQIQQQLRLLFKSAAPSCHEGGSESNSLLSCTSLTLVKASSLLRELLPKLSPELSRIQLQGSVVIA